VWFLRPQLAGPPLFKAALLSIGEGSTAASGGSGGNGGGGGAPAAKQRHTQPLLVDPTLGVRYTNNRWF